MACSLCVPNSSTLDCSACLEVAESSLLTGSDKMAVRKMIDLRVSVYSKLSVQEREGFVKIWKKVSKKNDVMLTVSERAIMSSISKSFTSKLKMSSSSSSREAMVAVTDKLEAIIKANKEKKANKGKGKGKSKGKSGGKKKR